MEQASETWAREIAEGTFRVALDPMVVIDGDGIIRRFNHAAEEVFGHAADDVIGRNVAVLVPEPHKTDHDTYIRNYLEGRPAGIVGTGREVEAERADGSRFPAHLSVTEVRVEGMPYFVGTVRDLTQQKEHEAALNRYIEDAENSRAQFEEQASEMAGLAEELHAEKERVEEQRRIIEHQATHDALTDLGNRDLLNRRLPAMLDEAAEAGARVGFLYIDLDNFKPVNDRFGHDTGDRLLRDVAEALCTTIGAHDVAFRLGGDEFAVAAWLDPGQDRSDLNNLAHRLSKALHIPISGGDFVIETGASVGMAVFPDDARGMDALLTAADNAMYRAKEAGKGRTA